MKIDRYYVLFKGKGYRTNTKYFNTREKAEKFASKSDTIEIGYIAGGKLHRIELEENMKNKKKTLTEQALKDNYNRFFKSQTYRDNSLNEATFAEGIILSELDKKIKEVLSKLKRTDNDQPIIIKDKAMLREIGLRWLRIQLEAGAVEETLQEDIFDGIFDDYSGIAAAMGRGEHLE